MTDKRREYGEGNYEGAERYQRGAGAHAGTEASKRAAEAAKHDRDVNQASLDAAERAGKSRVAEFDPELFRPTWWSKRCDSLWEQAREALARDWEQTKRDFGKTAGEELDQHASDTLRQVVGLEPVPGEGVPADKPAHWRVSNAATRAGFAAALQAQHGWDDDAKRRVRDEMETADIPFEWASAEPFARFGWYAAYELPSVRARQTN